MQALFSKRKDRLHLYNKKRKISIENNMHDRFYKFQSNSPKENLIKNTRNHDSLLNLKCNLTPVTTLKNIPYVYQKISEMVISPEKFQKMDKELPNIEIDKNLVNNIDKSVTRNLKKYKQNRRVKSMVWDYIRDFVTENPREFGENLPILISPKVRSTNKSPIKMRESEIKNIDDLLENENEENLSVKMPSEIKKINNETKTELQLPYLVTAHKKTTKILKLFRKKKDDQQNNYDS